MINIYLAGPITGQTEEGAKSWHGNFSMILRDKFTVSEDVPKEFYNLISPLRCEPETNGRYDVPGNGQHNDLRFGTAEAIAAKNETDVRRCDVIVAYFPSLLENQKISIGTIVEVAWGKMLNKPIIIVAHSAAVVNHPLIKSCAGWMVHDFESAADIIYGVFKDYET